MRTERFTTNEQSKKTRSKAILSAFAIAGGTLLSTACGGSEGAPAPNEGRVVTDLEYTYPVVVTEIIYGEECRDRGMYSVGTVAKPDSDAFTDKEEFAGKVVFYDGPEESPESKAVTPDAFTVSKLWASYQIDMSKLPAEHGGSEVDIVAYEDDTRKGNPNKDLAVCAFVSTAHGSIN